MHSVDQQATTSFAGTSSYTAMDTRKRLEHASGANQVTAAPSEPDHPIDEDVDDKKPQRFLMHTRPVHTQPARSLLTRKKRRASQATNRPSITVPEPVVDSRQNSPVTSSIGGVDFTGVKHLVFIIVAVGNLRLLAADVRSFGFLNVLKNISVVNSDIIATLVIATINFAFLPAALIIERAAFKGAKEYKAKIEHVDKKSSQKIAERADRKRGWSRIAFAHTINALACLGVSSALCYAFVDHPLLGIPLEANTIVVFLKLSSYALTNRDLRDAYVTGAPTPAFYAPAAYPSNLSIGNLLYFTLAPTLVYQPVYPRTAKIRWHIVWILVVELLAAGSFVWFMGMHISYRILQHAFLHYQSSQHADLADDFLGLIVVVMILWILSFFVLFQSALNLIAELTRFADRDFYGPWWNAGSVGAFWRHWNRPVSNYLRRHFYVPLRKRGFSTVASSSMVFLFSAVLHELLFGVPLRTFNMVAFSCMVAQIPLIAVTNPLESMRGYGTIVGNCIFWLSICLGLPAGMIMYYLSWSIHSH